jgi:H+/Cl- antiporter ClcA
MITASFFAIEVLGDRFLEGKWQLDWMWAAILCTGLLVSVILRTLKKLHVIRHRPVSPKQTLLRNQD